MKYFLVTFAILTSCLGYAKEVKKVILDRNLSYHITNELNDAGFKKTFKPGGRIIIETKMVCTNVVGSNFFGCTVSQD